jgi:NADPH2:quinone reductase
MRAIVSTPDGQTPAELRDVPSPTPSANEAVVRVHAASINRGELTLLATRPGWVPGQDVAGVVVRPAEDGSGPAAGSRVVAVADQGGWAEEVAVSTTRVAPLPDTVPFATASTLGIAALTALRGLREGGFLLGRRVLVTGAAGGVGHFAVQLGDLGGAHVTAVGRDEEQARWLRRIGADEVVGREDDLPGGFDVVMEGVGGHTLERSVRALAPRGIAVLYGAADPEPARIGLLDFLTARAAGARVQAFLIYETGSSTFGADLGRLAGMVGAGSLQPQVGLAVDWHEIDRATAALRDRRVLGKVVLLIQ